MVPTSQDVQLLLLDLALILVLARVLGAVARRLGQPPVVGEILAGILLGPSLFNGTITAHLFPDELLPILRGIADLGLALFMFIVGYELDRRLIRGRERVAATVSLGSIALPLAGGFGLGYWLATDNANRGTASFALFIGAAMSITAFPVLARILTDRGLHRTRVGGLAIASAAVDDIAAWTLLAVVITVASVQGADQWHLFLAPVYLAVMLLVVRPLLRRVGDRYASAGRLTPDSLAVVLVVLLLSAGATEWLGVHFIFGAFIAGAVMPREAAEPLREAILERLEQVSVLLLLPVFFVVSGLSVDLSQIDGTRFVELLAILGVAIGGKFLGAYLGARSSGVGARQSGVLATLMNTRGLTEIVILNVGMQNGIIAPPLFTLMVLMALITTAMTGPLLRVVYPPRLVARDLADAARADLAAAGDAFRVLVVVRGETPDVDATNDSGTREDALVDIGVDLAAARRPAQVVLSRLITHERSARLEVGTGLGSELLLMTRAMAGLHALAERGARRQVEVSVHSQFSEDVAADLTRHVLGADPALVVIPEDVRLAPHDMLPRLVVARDVLPAAPSAVAVHRRHAGPDAEVALQVGAQIAVGRGLGLVLVDGAARRDRAAQAELERLGVGVTTGDVPPGALVVGTEHDLDAHLVAHARPDDEVDDVDEWVSLVTAERQS